MAAKKKAAKKKTVASARRGAAEGAGTTARDKAASKKTAVKQETASKKTAVKQETASKKTAAKQEAASKKTAVKKKAATKKKAVKKKVASEDRAPVRFDERGLGPVMDNGRRQVGCLTCGLCCTYVTAEAEAPTTVRKATELLWNLYHDRVSVHFDSEDWLIQFETRCQHLMPDNKCAIYERRPHVCREHDELECEVNHEMEGITFYTPRQFLEFLQKRRKRVYADLRAQGYLPPEESLDGQMQNPRKLPAFDPRFRKLRVLGATE